MARTPRQLTKKVTTALTDRDRTRLSITASKLGTSAGLLARALILDGLTRISEPSVRRRINAEIEDAKARHAAAGKAGMARRWGKDKN